MKKLILLLLILSGVRAQGQETSLTPPEWWWQSDSAHYRTAESLALPALLSFVPDGRPISVSINAVKLQQTPLPLKSIAQRKWGYKIWANGGKRLGKFSVIGQAFFGKVDEINLSHNLTNHADYFYPFVIADTVRKRLYAERYHTSFGASYSATPLVKIGIALGYTGEMRYARIDPRVQNISSEIYGTASVALDLGRWGQLSAGVTRQNYVQQLSFSVLKPGKSQLIYVMRPMGEYNFKYSGFEDNGTYRPLLTMNKAILAWQIPQRNLVVFAEATNTATKMETRQAGVIVNQKKIEQIKGGLDMDLLNWDRYSLGGIVQIDAKREKGYENIYKDEIINDFSSLTTPILVTSNHTYTQKQHNLAAALRWRMQTNSFELTLTGNYRRKYIDNHSTQGEKAENMRWQRLGSATKIRYKTTRWIGESAFEMDYRFDLKTSQKLNTIQGTYHIAKDRWFYLQGETMRWRLSQSCMWYVDRLKNKLLSVGISGQLGRWGSLGWTYDTNLNIGYLF